MKLLCLLLPFWFPIKPTGTIESVRPTKAFFFSEPYTIYKNKEEKYIVHSDICPHQGASLSTGKITKEWMDECKNGQKNFLATRAKLAEHSVEKVGAELRAMMPWISKKKLVDSDKK